MIQISDRIMLPGFWEPHSLLWGTEKDITAEQFLGQQVKFEDPDYQIYLQLKERFENNG